MTEKNLACRPADLCRFTPLIRTAIFSNRSRMVENTPLANGCGLGMALRTISISR
jgi:hypothetical protein